MDSEARSAGKSRSVGHGFLGTLVFHPLRYNVTARCVRPRNIVLESRNEATQQAMLIDFDWVGEHQVSKYPASWNRDTLFSHPHVCRMGLMDKAHDIYMLQQLKATTLHL